MSLVRLRHRAAGGVLSCASWSSASELVACTPMAGRRADAGDTAGDDPGHPAREVVHAGRPDAARFDANVAARAEPSPTRWRASPIAPAPLIETLAGLAIAMPDGLCRATASSIPAPRPASSSRSSPRSCWRMSRPSGWRGSISISTSRWSSVRVLFEVIDSPRHRTAGRRPARR